MRRLGEFLWNGLNTGYSASHFRCCFPITSLFHVRGNNSWSHYNSCFWSSDEVLAWYAPLCGHGLPLIPLSYQLICWNTGQNANPYYWMQRGMTFKICSWIFCWSPLFVVNCWLAVRFNLLSAALIWVTGLVCLVTPSISASTAGFALAFASTITKDLLKMVCSKWSN